MPSLSQINQDFIKRLSVALGKSEAEAVFDLLVLHLTGKSKVELMVSQPLTLNEIQLDWMENAILRLLLQEPIQYILGYTHFLGLDIVVNPAVLIPRPETEELATWVLQSENQSDKSVLDLCTGSGCIALALQKLGNWQKVAGLDVSDSALEVARQNSERLGLEIDWIEVDLLKAFSLDKSWDVLVSNPPYVLPSEAVDMTKGVLAHEPSLALFTPENDPILFYKTIGKLALKSLNPGGTLFFELNPKTAHEVADFLQNLGFEGVEIKKDMFGKERMLKAIRPAP